MITRIVVSAVLVIVYFVFLAVYQMVQGPVEASMAVGQLSDSAVEYAAARAVAQGAVKTAAFWVLIVVLTAMWLSFLLRLAAKGSGSVKGIFLAFVIFGLAACGPYQAEIIEEIGPQESAFVVPLEGNTKDAQGKFMSVEYLNGAKVATKRVTIPTRRKDIGRMPGSFVWIPTVKVIKVDRKPVTRVWTQSAGTGTSPTNQAICVESVESIDFCLGVTAASSVTENDAAKFLYHYAGKPLAEVMDQDVRGYASAILAREFGSRPLDKGRREKGIIFASAFEETRKFFADRGVTLLQFGSTEGMSYRDSKIQDAINATFVAENDKNTAENQRLAQEKRNQLNVEKAKAERQAAEEFAKALDAQKAKIALDIEMVRAQAQLEAAKNLKDLKGQLPSVLPQGSSLLFGFDKPATAGK